MFRIHAGSTRKYCDGLSRRHFVQLGVAGMASAGLADVWRAQEASAAQGATKKDTSVILIWLDGGPSHMDLYDMKPEAPAEYRGIWQPIPTNVPGFEITGFWPAFLGALLLSLISLFLNAVMAAGGFRVKIER